MASQPQQVEFRISPKIATGIRLFYYLQLFVTPPYSRRSFANQIIIVNTGLGLEAARHFYRSNCSRLILAVRTIAKGQATKEDIVIEVWPLDMSSTASIVAFTDRVKTELPRVNVLVKNAGIKTSRSTLVEGYEQAAQVNVLNTFLLELLLLPKLKETKSLFSDSLHEVNRIPLQARDNFPRLKRKQKTPGPSPVIVNIANPGLSTSVLRVLRRFIDLTAEVGSRTLALTISASPSSHGEYQGDGVNQAIVPCICEGVGQRALKQRSPDILHKVGLA
ncbi:hypothetical protein BJX65DRAFT_293339 [Aspergillus insuetus]